MSRPGCYSVRELNTELRSTTSRPRGRDHSLAAVVGAATGYDYDIVENLLGEIDLLAESVERSFAETDLDGRSAEAQHANFIWHAIDGIRRKLHAVNVLRDAERAERDAEAPESEQRLSAAAE